MDESLTDMPDLDVDHVEDQHDKELLSDITGSSNILPDTIIPGENTSSTLMDTPPGEQSHSKISISNSNSEHVPVVKGKEKARSSTMEGKERPLRLLDLPTDVLREIVKQVDVQFPHTTLLFDLMLMSRL